MLIQNIRDSQVSNDSYLDDLFQKRIDNHEIIEPSDWMPLKYRQTLIRQIAQHAHSEYVGMLLEASWLKMAPTLARKCILLAKVQDEVGHAQYLYGVLETLGYSRYKAIVALINGQSKYLNIFNYPALTWADVGMIGWLTDGAAIVNQVPLSNCSYGPYARAMKKICQEESFHSRQGFDLVNTLLKGTAAQQKMTQDAFNRWWWPTLMVFGPPDEESIHTKLSLKWKIKSYTNNQLRQKFIDQTIPQAKYLGLTIPDKDLTFDADQNRYQIGEINWKEFYDVINGKGPCNRSRLAVRKGAWLSGKWYRDAMIDFVKRDIKMNVPDINKYI